MGTTALAESDGNQVFENILGNALKLPGIKVDRQEFLKETFSGRDPKLFYSIVNDGPVAAGCTQYELDRIAADLITKRTMQSTGMSFAAGLPGGLAMAATIPADTLQFFGMALRLAQEIAYIYGGEDLWHNGEVDDERVKGQLILYCGVMFGVSGSSAAVKVLSSTMAKQAAKKLPQKALMKTVYYPIIKKTAAFLGVKVTRETFAKGVSKAIPVVGGVISGGLTFASMRPMGRRLANTLSEANFEYTQEAAQADLERLYHQGHADEPIDLEPDEPVVGVDSDGGVADTLLKYQKLLEADLLTREEFEALKQKLLESGEV